MATIINPRGCAEGLAAVAFGVVGGEQMLVDSCRDLV